MPLKEKKICALVDLQPDSACAFSVGRGDWPFKGFLVRQGDSVYAYANSCPHQRHPLNIDANDFLTPDAALIRCASHGAQFSIASGVCIAGPCPGKSLAKLNSRVEHGDVLVFVPDSMRDFEDLRRSGVL